MRDSNTIFRDLCIGGISGTLSRTLTAPIELYKIQKQNPFIPHSTLKDVIRQEGVFGLWKGNGINCMRIFPQMSINYTIYHNSKQYIWSNYFNSHALHIASGTTAGFISTIAIYPLETIRSRLSLQTNHNHYQSIRHAITSLHIHELYRGLTISLCGFVPYNALNFTFYHYFKDMLLCNANANDNTYAKFIHFIAGGFSGVCAVLITYPTDLLRRRMHLQGFETTPTYHSIPHGISTIYTQEGISGFYRGLLACCLKLFPATAIQFSTMEYLKRVL